MGQFGHRSLRVYAATLEVYGDALGILRHGQRTTGWVENQLLRALASVALNIAEGAAEFSPGDKVRFYRIARRSAAEASAAFDLLARERRIGEAEGDAENRKLEAIASMLTVMIHKVRETRSGFPDSRPGPGPGPVSRNQKPAPDSSPRNQL